MDLIFTEYQDFHIQIFKVMKKSSCHKSLLVICKCNPLPWTSLWNYIPVPIGHVLSFILQMDSNNSLTQKATSTCLLKFLLAHGLLKQSDQNISGIAKRSKKIIPEEARATMLFAKHLTTRASSFPTLQWMHLLERLPG